ncbi:HUWE1 [Mytilus coruscus]|uniref:HUWE1 n=1 Tax=Mytilus coruscus TaxID=42192 RepID=A0A6J8B0N7_MYTCO|nr:HUWE1 [Mytilus coruscus]
MIIIIHDQPFTTPRGRGRPSFRHWRASLFLLNKPMSTLKEFKRDCLDNGFGPPGSGTVSLDRRWSLPQLEDFIYQCYPQHPLQLVGFQYAKCLKGAKRELQIVHSNNVTDLASTIRAGKVYIVPNREIPATQRTNVSQLELDDEEDLPTPTASPPHTPSPPNELEDTVPLTDSPIETVSPVISFRRRIASIAARANIREAAEQILVSEEDESSHSNDVIATAANETTHVDVVPLAAEDDDTLHLRLDTTEENVSAQTEPGVNEGLEHLQLLLGDNKELAVRRQSVLTDVIQAYEDPQLVGQRLVIRFEGELGQDAGGLTKDLFSAFWDAAFKTYFVGERCCVPFLPIHRFSESSIYPILGRILTHGTALTGVFPTL